MTAQRGELARNCDSFITDAQYGLNKRSMVIGWYGAILKEEQLFGELGYESEKHYYESKGVGRSVWWQTTALAQAFRFLTIEQFVAMKLENAQKLSKVDPEHCYDEDLLAKAATESIAEFDLTVDKFLAAKLDRPVGEMRGKLKLSMSRDQIAVVKSKLNEFMRAHEIDSEGYALECLLAEVSDRETLVGKFRDVIRGLHVKAVNGTYTTIDDARDEMLLLAGEMQRTLNDVVGDTAKPARNGLHRVA